MKDKADYTAIADEHLSCREFRHAWQQEGPYRVTWGAGSGKRRLAREFERTVVCIRCGTRRKDRFTGFWDRDKANYGYAEGYQLKGVDRGNVTREVHREFFRRATERHGVEESTDA